MGKRRLFVSVWKKANLTTELFEDDDNNHGRDFLAWAFFFSKHKSKMAGDLKVSSFPGVV